MPGSKVLVVEDEFLIRVALAEALRDEGFEVLEAGSGDEALARLRQEAAIALLLTDIRLPGKLDGIGLALEARRNAPDLPVIYLTGGSDRRIESEVAGPSAVFAKPYLPSDVCAAARRMTGG
jgi:CheY-like chemotaxis protein